MADFYRRNGILIAFPQAKVSPGDKIGNIAGMDTWPGFSAGGFILQMTNVWRGKKAMDERP
jgi:hypothetical protein